MPIRQENQPDLTSTRRQFIASAAAITGATALPALAREFPTNAHASAPGKVDADLPSFEFDEATIAELQRRMQAGELSARSLTEKYLARIHAIDKCGPAINAIIELNPDALSLADALDGER